MKKLKNPYQVFDNYILRTPLFSYQFYKDLYQNDPITEADFKAVFETPIINEALYIASPELHQQLDKWFSGDLNDNTRILRLQDSLLKYTSRLTTRSTPFGLFASCTIGNFSQHSEIQINDNNHFKRLTRFDMTFLSVLSQELIKNPLIKEQLLFYPNSTLYKIGSQYRYVEYKIQNKRREYFLEGVTYSEAIDAVLKNAISGKSISNLSQDLVSNEITVNDANEFIQELIKEQILVSQLEIPVTGHGAFNHILETLKPMSHIDAVFKNLEHLYESLNRIDAHFGNPDQVYKSLAQDIKSFNLNFDSKYLFQTDLFSTSSTNALEFKYKKDLKEVMQVLNKITRTQGNKNLTNFKTSFTKRYEDNEIPLTHALDVESGIGYGTERADANSIVDDLVLPIQKSSFETIKWSKFDDILLKKINDAISNKSKSFTLLDSELEGLTETWDDLPGTMSSIIELVNYKEHTKIVINGISGSSASNLLARFSQGNSEIATYIDKITTAERHIYSDSILAEIVHLPQDRTGNILHRLSFRDYEIPYLGKSSLPQEQQISINDLMVSVKNGSIYLRSLTHKKYVIPRLTNAHNYPVDALPIYHFLCDLQSQNERVGIQFSWNSIFQKYDFLPRVEYKNFIFSKARWLVKNKDISHLTNHINSIQLTEVNLWKQRINLPRYVELVEGDNTLLIDLENLRAIQMLLKTIKTKKTFILQEFLFTEDGVVKQNKKTLCNEFVISFYNESKLNPIQK